MSQPTSTAYAPTLGCAKCINSGYTYVYGANGENKSGTSAESGYCCRNKGASLYCGLDEELYAFYTGTASFSKAQEDTMRQLF